MKRLLLLLLILLSVSAFAQRRKSRAKKKATHTVRHKTKHRARHRASREEPVEEEVAEEEKPAYPFLTVDSATKKMVLKDPSDEKDRPFVLLNDNVYTGLLEDIKPESILDISLVNKKGARIMYGQKAAAGALLIKTKQPLPADLPNAPVPNTSLPLAKLPVKQKAFILNEEVTDKLLVDIDPTTILKIDSLIQPKFVGSKENDTMLNVTTKYYGTKWYQWKFGTFSKAYKTYIRSRRGKDAKVVYILPDGTELTGEDKLQLFEEATKADIKSVNFTPARSSRKGSSPTTVTIELNEGVN